jgi:hypothetical protein
MIDPFSTATEIAAAIRLRRVSALEVLDLYLSGSVNTTRR